MRRGVDALFDRRLSVEEPELRPTHLGQLVRELVAGFDTAGHPVEVAADSVVILADPLLVERILDNVLANALEHSPADTPVRVGVRVAAWVTTNSLTMRFMPFASEVTSSVSAAR